jgi:phage terminase large subunit-like protein
MRIDFTYNEYIHDVIENKVIVPVTIKKVVERHLKDIKRKRFEYEFNEKWAQFVITFFSTLKHFKGKYAGKPFLLEPWQQFLIAMLYGWRNKKTGRRRFKTLYFTVARKNGKTILIAGLMLLETLTEKGAEIYSVATKLDQAAIAFKYAKSMLNDYLKQKGFRALKDRIIYQNSILKALCSESKTLDGFEPGPLVLIDEYHEHKTDELKHVMESGMVNRSQPLTIITTTAGQSSGSPCYEEYSYARQIATGALKDDTYLPIIYELDTEDDWTNRLLWKKANPNYHILNEDEFENRYQKALRSPSTQIDFRRKQLNLWVESITSWIDLETWKSANPFDPAILQGAPCIMGLDIAKLHDFTAYSLVFYIEDEFYTLTRFFIPRTTIEERFRNESQNIYDWIDKGYVFPCETPTLDVRMLIEKIKEDAIQYQITEILYDRALADEIIRTLEDEGFECIQHPQNMTGLSGPSREFEKAALNGRIHHNNNPVLNWMLANTTIEIDNQGNFKPKKEDYRRSTRRIDGVITNIMAVGRWVSLLIAREEPDDSFDYSSWAPITLSDIED